MPGGVRRVRARRIRPATPKSFTGWPRARPTPNRTAPIDRRTLTRRCVQLSLSLRSEASKFALSAFGLQAPIGQAGRQLLPREEEEQLGERLARFQELLTRLENAWGTDQRVFYPADTGSAPEAIPCYASVQERPLHLITDFIDFTPLLALRKALNQRLANQTSGNIPVGCLLLWCLARQPEFAEVTFATTAVSIKGEYSAICRYPPAIRQALKASSASLDLE